jgi:hypothetical protein
VKEAIAAAATIQITIPVKLRTGRDYLSPSVFFII